MFPVRVRIENREGLLKPGMNTEVEIHVGRRDGVLAIPNAALRTQKDVGSAAMVLGLSPDAVQQQLAAAPADTGAAGTRTTSTGGGDGKPAGNTMTTPDGRVIQLPSGVTETQVKAIFAKFRSGETPTPAERAILQKLRGQNGGGGGQSRSTTDNRFGARYIVFVMRQGRPTPVQVNTGLTDLDYSEVKSGLQEGDSVLVLPSASLVQSQQEFKDRIGRMTGGGLPGLKQQTSGSQGAAARPSAGRP
jgi:HlyD family secretion protein